MVFLFTAGLVTRLPAHRAGGSWDLHNPGEVVIPVLTLNMMGAFQLVETVDCSLGKPHEVQQLRSQKHSRKSDEGVKSDKW